MSPSPPHLCPLPDPFFRIALHGDHGIQRGREVLSEKILVRLSIFDELMQEGNGEQITSFFPFEEDLDERNVREIFLCFGINDLDSTPLADQISNLLQRDVPTPIEIVELTITVLFNEGLLFDTSRPL